MKDELRTFPARHPPRPAARASLPAGRDLLPAACLLLICGCWGRGYKLAPVSGHVTLDRKLRAGVHVSFQPRAEGPDAINPGPGSYGVTDAEGRYRLQTVDPTEPGAVIGTHRVRFWIAGHDVSASDDHVRPPERPLPARYTDGSTTFVVSPEGTDGADFDLRSQ